MTPKAAAQAKVQEGRMTLAPRQRDTGHATPRGRKYRNPLMSMSMAYWLVRRALENRPDPKRKAYQRDERSTQHLTVALEGTEPRAL
jgi:hypothetical protein